MEHKTWRVSDTIARLERDPWRIENPFSEDMVACHNVLFDVGSSRADIAHALADWLAQSQPCLFGQMEAKQHRLAFCVLTENDLERSDQEIRARIQAERADWREMARTGASHGFLIVAIGEAIAQARRSPALRGLAAELCGLYVDRNEPDAIHHDELILEIQREDETLERRRWKVGVNYFSAQGDRLWWHDHRIPGGMAFSMNSVGHMARTRAESEIHRNPTLSRQCAAVPREKLVYFALRTAMKTIGPPVAGGTRGTWLADRGTFTEDREPPTFEVRHRYFGELARYSENGYHGRYHTDRRRISMRRFGSLRKSDCGTTFFYVFAQPFRCRLRGDGDRPGNHNANRGRCDEPTRRREGRVMTLLDERVFAAFAGDAPPSSWEGLMDLFRADREAFYLLACKGETQDADPRIHALADLAAEVRTAVRETYEFVPREGGADLTTYSGRKTFIQAPLVEAVAEFLRVIDGKTSGTTAGRGYEGEEISEAEVRFKLGERGSFDAQRLELDELRRAKPLVLRIDAEELKHLATQPAYVTHELLHCARRTVLAPTAVFKGLERGREAPSAVNDGWAFCGQPRQAYRNDGSPVPAPERMLHVVYADAEGFVFDWDWVREDPNQPGYPLDCEIRFGELVTSPAESRLELPGDLQPGILDATKPCYSSRGDCIFCYITCEESHAVRINPDLTVFQEFGTGKYTGFKVKNVQRILQVDQSIVINDAPGLSVFVDSVLLATLKRNPNEKVEIYAVLIRALHQNVHGSPMVQVPPPPKELVGV